MQKEYYNIENENVWNEYEETYRNSNPADYPNAPFGMTAGHNVISE